MEMLAKSSNGTGRNWDIRLPYVLFAYQVHESSSFNCRVPMHSTYFMVGMLGGQLKRHYHHHFSVIPLMLGIIRQSLPHTWQTLVSYSSGQCEEGSESRHIEFSPGDRVFVFMHLAQSGTVWKLSCPYYGLYQFVSIKENGLEVRPVD